MPSPIPKPKPMAQAKRVSLFHREIRIGLSSAAVEILLGQATLLSEGQIDGDEFYGSTMLTIDCSRAIDWVSDPCDATTIRQLGDLLLRDDRFRDRVRELCEREAQRLAREALCPAQVEMRLRCNGNNLHVDVDLEAQRLKASAS